MSKTARRLGPQDLFFLYSESPSTMMHVGGLMPFTPPPGAPKDFLRQLVEESKENEVVEPWNLKLSHPDLLFSPLQSWVYDDNFDLDYHVRRSALASPGDERELGILVSRLHSNALDLRRPPWEMHFIEGLEDGRFAIYVKMHHALVDGYTGQKMLARSLSTDPNDTTHPLFFNIPTPGRAAAAKEDNGGGIAGSVLSGVSGAVTNLGGVLSGVGGVLGSLAGAGRSSLDLTRAIVNTQLRSDNEYRNLIGSVQAPRSILNTRISRNRRFATQQYQLDRLKSIGAEHDATLNDVALAIVGGSLRRFLDELGELPDRALIAMLPVNVRPKDDEGGGNAVATILGSLGTDIADPVERLHAVTATTRVAKAQLATMDKDTILAYSAALMAPFGMQLASTLSGVKTPLPYTFNLCVSNVPGPRERLYLRGSRMEASFPVSLVTHSQALNITLQSYADTINFGFIGCRDTLPHLQRIAVYTGEALDELEAATGL
ncbi:wax ester/triacylglycerol synthase family O-acyltransferase [Mycobacterium intermedium]|uniref:Diacylglycerol O-acyltransferase n=1 Tax=Mycobacterium intermedium TaxID=28445 RepID=A0A1E3S3N2_MYCIE|nr:wax ester/triacylglycerol synthase family O-acyltransferase [Mycobacterium intermedium]MCV6967588.1 wax ester/triacylglycerol synthase family O-acyltransferase [Mycobacterium intermedium]ODQ96783.1 diacylglycerol O-acyltransferase [Mycobacterium intermedium]ORB04117.1 wax ester/triacylglycerol synthase family O-acyltransferase [Mycobacterium intermedium]